MKNEPSFDQFLKHKLQQHKSPVPQGLWEKIAAQNEANKPVGFWWKDNLFLMMVFSGLLLSATYFFTEKDLRSQADMGLLAKNISSVNLDNISSAKAKNNAIAVIDNHAPTNLVAIDQNQINNTAGPVNGIVVYQPDKYLTSNKLSNLLMTIDPANTGNIITETVAETDNQTAINNQFYINSNLFADNNTDIETVHHLLKENIVPVLSPTLNNKDFKALKVNTKKPLFGLACPNGLPSNWYVEAYGSRDINMKSLYGDDNSQAYLQRMDSTTTMSGGFTFGIRMSKNITDRLLLKTGIQYSQINERFKSKIDSVLTITTVVSSRIIVRGNGLADTTIRDTSSLQQIGYKVTTTRNQYKSIEIPIIASYERGNEKWRIALNGGAIINLSSWYNGETFDTAYRVVPLSDKQANGFYKSNINLSLYAGISVLRKIGNGLEAFAEPYFRYNLSNAATSGAGYTQRFNSAGLSFGLRYKLNRKSSSTEN